MMEEQRKKAEEEEKKQREEEAKVCYSQVFASTLCMSSLNLLSLFLYVEVNENIVTVQVNLRYCDLAGIRSECFCFQCK